MNIKTEQLKTLLGSEDAALRFVNMFLEQLPAQMATLHQSQAAGDLDTLQLTAHGLKSPCRYLGLDDAADLLQKMENEPDHVELPRWLSSLEAVFKS
jgi:HPt (histidine-containing phosphotransfer) domain-containing protein